ncbi:MAG: STT3 domain-containing protein [Candidatus Thorarchaeota archaeon]|jgi:dolichyl-diphosphooligosaccharide--protein glycosyltransferase
MSGYDRFKRSTGRFLRQIFHRPKAKISRGSVILVIALTIIFFAALILRLYPLLNSQPVLRAFDPWFQLKVTEYVVDNGYGAFFTWFDETTWVPFGRDITTTSYVGVPFTSAFFYFILNGFGISVDVLTVSLVMPAFLGALTAIAAFFLGRELMNNTVGLLSALLLAFLPAFIQRTVAGFYDNECVGVLAIVVSTFFYTRSLKRGSLPSAVGAGLALGYLLISWGGGDFLLGLFALYAFVMLISGRYNKRLLNSYLITVALGIFIGGLIPRNGFANLTTFSTLAPIGIGVLLAGYEIWLRIESYREATATFLAPHMKPILLGLITPIAGIAAYLGYAGTVELGISPFTSNPVVTLGTKFLTVINPFVRLDQRIFASVAEHLPSPWGSFYHTLNLLIFFFPLGLYFLFKRGRDEDWLIFLFGVTSVYFAGSMIRLSLILAPAVAVLSAVAVNGMLSPFSKVVTQKSVFERRRFRMSSSLTSEHAIVAFAFVGLLLSLNLYLGVNYVNVYVGTPEFAQDSLSEGARFTDWQTGMTYVRDVLPDDAIVASWWDYGYWINGAGEAETIVDNATWNRTQIALMGYALMSLNLTESLKTFKQWNTTHVLVYFGHRTTWAGGDDGKWPWMVRIAEDRFGSELIDDAWYLGDDPTTTTVEEEYMLDTFFESTLYKLMVYGEPVSQEEGQAMGLTTDRVQMDQFYQQDTRWLEHMPVDLFGAFINPYTSSNLGTVKIYEIDYTMYEQYLNRTTADWIAPDLSALYPSLSGVELDGNISAWESTELDTYDVVFGGNYGATVYTGRGSTHIYYGIQMDNYTKGEDAFGIQIAPFGSPGDADLRLVDYDGHEFYDGHIAYDGAWAEDSSGTNSSLFASGENVIEFMIPLNSDDAQDVSMNPGMNYQIRLLFWNNVKSGEPTFDSDWVTFWVEVELH